MQHDGKILKQFVTLDVAVRMAEVDRVSPESATKSSSFWITEVDELRARNYT